MLSKALVSGVYQKKLEELARLPDLELIALVPPFWREPRTGVVQLERRFTSGYRLEVLPMAFNGRHHFHFYPGLGRVLAHERPDIFHVDEEAFNLATFLAFRAGLAVGARCCFYNYANIDRYYPPPFNLFERYVFRHAAYGMVCNQEAAAIIRRHGYTGPNCVLPQFGVDPDLFSPKAAAELGRMGSELASSNGSRADPPRAPFVIGYAGRLVPEKGVMDLIEALPGLPDNVVVRLVGDGVLRAQIERRASELGLTARVELHPAVPSTSIPVVLQQLDALVLPSHTTANWKEQFGRILIEAMSCGVPVIGAASGEIPNVIGDAGLIVPERNSAALRGAITRLLHDGALRHELRQRGRARVLAHYTQAALARRYYAIYGVMLNSPVSYSVS